MKEYLIYMVLILFSIQLINSQEDGVVSLDIPIRNSLKFNRYLLDPTFSFVREQNMYLSFYNKREWVQFEDAPQTFLASYSGKFRENSGLGIGLFQQNYGVLTTFGGVLNFAYNVTLDRESNLTFGMNLGVYKSGLNDGKVITNYPDPSLDNIPSNTLLTINPGINYGTRFFDFGLSVNNVVLYNLKSSQMVEDDPQQGVQAHVMYTGYMESSGFFDQAKFSGLLRSEFNKDNTILSGIAMVTVPKGIWAQAGYNSLYGMSVGIGLNISEQISIEYNYEKGMGNLSNFGSSHEIALAYKFKNNNRYNNIDSDEEEALIFSKNRRRGGIVRAKTPKKPTASGKEKAKLADENRAIAQADREARLNAQADEEARLKLEAETQANIDEAAKIKAAEEEAIVQAEVDKAKAEEDAKLKAEAEVQAKAQEEAKIKAQEETRARAQEETRLNSAEEARVKAAEIARLKDEEAKEIADEEARLKLEAETQAKTQEEARLKAAEEEARVKAAEIARLKAEEIAKAEEEAKLKAEAEVEKEPEIVPTDWTTRSMNDLDKLSEEFKKTQEELLTRLEEAVAVKEKDLKDMKEENDLSEQGIFVAPKPFKSLTAENAALESLKSEIDNVIKTQEDKITEFENLFNERFKNVPDPRDSNIEFYQKKIQELKSDQLNTVQSKKQLESKLEVINVATEVERKRRIRRAAYDNVQDMYLKDRMTLSQIKANTPSSTVPLKAEDFDFGEEQSSNIQIVKNVKNEESGYYMVIAVHSDIEKRDEFLTKAVSAGQYDINFFYDVNSSKYFIYYEKFDSVNMANRALEARGSKPFNGNMSIIKIEN
jgi:type IX secretion system PorP/SprF family membrane protein